MTILVLTQHPHFKIVDNAAARYAALRDILVQTSTFAHKLITALDNAPSGHTIGVVLTSAAGLRDDDELMAPGSVYYPPTVDGAVPANCTGGVALLNLDMPLTVILDDEQRAPGEAGKKITLPTAVSLAHELGHAYQYEYFRDDFMRRFTASTTDAGKKPIPAREIGRAGVSEGRGAQLVIENDNIVMWERPICHQFGLPQRVNYESDIARYHYPRGQEI